MRKPIRYDYRIIIPRLVVFATTLAFAIGVSRSLASTVSETVTVSSSPNLTINPSFVGLSYEKKQMTDGYFSSTNTALIKLFNMLGHGVLRIGAGQVDIYNWNGVSNCPPVTTADMDRFTGFITNVPNWKVIYGINFASNNAANCGAEAQYAASKLGSQLIGFEIGNEPEAYHNNGMRPSSFTYSDYISQWNPLKLAAEQYGAIVGPASGGTPVWTTNFVHDESAIISMATQHYYRDDGSKYTYGSPTAMQLMLQPDSAFVANISSVVPIVNAYDISLGLHMDECGSFSHGGVAGVSDAYGAALWTLDFMFTVALNGGQGVNFHGGGRSPYTPLFDNKTATVQQVRPEFYGLKTFSLVPAGKVVSTTVSPAQPYYTAYGVKCTSGGTSVLLNNKDTAKTMATTVNLGSNVSSAILYELTGSSWYATNGYTLGGTTINPDGSWSGTGQSIIYTSSGQLTVNVPPYNAFLLNPVTIGTKPVAVTSGPYFNVRGTLTTGPADVSYHYGGSSATWAFMGDWDNTGHMGPGVAFINSNNQWEWQLRDNNSGGGATYDFVYGSAMTGDILVVGDWDGNGTWSPGIVRANSSGQLEWLLSNSHSGGGASYDFVYGNAGDTPIVGDWTNQGKFTPGVVVAGTNTWALRNSNTAGSANITFGYGSSTDMPIVGDWDGNGTWTCGVIRNGNNWLLRNSNSSGGAQINFGYGAPGDAFLVWK